MERGIQGEVTDDRRAYLGFEQVPANTSNGTTDLEVRIINRYPTGPELTAVEVTVGETTVDLAEGGAVGPGRESAHTFTSVPCGARVTVEARGNDVGVELNRSVSCG
jgi:hypothetical protein